MKIINKKFIKVYCILFAVMMIPIITNTQVIAKNSEKKQNEIVTDNLQPSADKIAFIDKYQKKYFDIVKRNNVLLNLEDTETLNNDRKDLENLFAETEKQITNKKYLKKYKKIQKKFSACDAITTTEINDCADKNYNAVNDLLNDVYKKTKSKLKPEELQDLALSEIKWQKEVGKYKKVYDSMGFGTIGTSIYYGYEINMREFRTLLLMSLI